MIHGRFWPPRDTGSKAATVAAPPTTAASTPQPSDVESTIGDCAVYHRGARVPGRLNLDGAVTAAKSTDGFVWIGVQQPSAAEFEQLAAAFSLPALAVEDAVGAHQRPKLEVYDDIVFAVLKPVRYVDSDEVIETAEIAVFVGPGFVITVRHGDSDLLSLLREDLDSAGPAAELLAHGPAAVLYAAADLVVDAYEEVATAIDEDIEQIEVQVFGGDTDEHAQRIYKLKREVLEFRRAVAPLAPPLQLLLEGKVRGIPDGLQESFRDVHDHALRVAERIEGHDRLLTDVLTADLAQVTVRQTRTAVRQNEDMRKISAWAAIALVPTAIAGIYGMNFDHMPELRWEYGYPLVMSVIVGICVGLQRLFRRRGWL